MHARLIDDLRPEDTQDVVIATVGAPHGLAGWVRVWPATEDPAAILEFRYFKVVGDPAVRLRLRNGRPGGKCCLVHFDGISDRAQAAALTGAELAVARAELPVLDSGEYYWYDLIGLSVTNAQGQDFGRVSRLLETGANDVLVVTGSRERYLPYLPGQVVKKVDLLGGNLVVDWDPDF